MIEKPPTLTDAELAQAYVALATSKIEELLPVIDEISDNYEYWSSVKYKILPQSVSSKELWALVKASRLNGLINVWPKFSIRMSVTNMMQRICHELDMNFGGTWGDNALIPEDGKKMYLVSSLMEEAISSSQMEGAATTRKVAKDMLRKKITPKDKSQQMIFNNYQTIRFIVENKDKPLTMELLLSVHKLMTEGTLGDTNYAGRFRMSDNVVVENGITHEVVHVPPSHLEIPDFISQLCDFFNGRDGGKMFIHPIIRGIVIHFMLAYVHPFVDGNGRTARALFYWYMLKQGYWLTEYLSISRIISRSKKTYEKSFLYSEADGNDIGYFVTYNLRVLDLAFKELQLYIKRKTEMKKQSVQFLRLEGINERQAEIIRTYYENPEKILTIKDLQIKFGVSPTTAKNDILKLMEMSIVSEISFNKVKKGYTKGDSFDTVINKLL